MYRETILMQGLMLYIHVLLVGNRIKLEEFGLEIRLLR